MVATSCDLASPVSQSWVANLIPAVGGRGRALGTVTDAVGDPGSAAAIVSGPVSPSAASSASECFFPETAPDKAVELRQPGRPARSYEYAALIAGRVPRRSLRSSVFIEQAVVLGFGVVTGVAAGVGSAALVLRNLPEFLAPPTAPSLLFVPSATQILVPLVVIAVLLAVAVTVATVALIRSARPELLREAPP